MKFVVWKGILFRISLLPTTAEISAEVLAAVFHHIENIMEISKALEIMFRPLEVTLSLKVILGPVVSFEDHYTLTFVINESTTRRIFS